MPRAPKFGTKKRTVFKGRSDFEGKIAADLTARGITFTYESDTLSYVKILCPHCNEVVDKGTYTPDFFIPRASGLLLIVEAKGYFDAAERRKIMQVKKSNPNADIRMLFYRDQKISKQSATTYTAWCKKNKLPCAVGTAVPQAWIDEPALTVGVPIKSIPKEKKRIQKPKEGELF